VKLTAEVKIMIFSGWPLCEFGGKVRWNEAGNARFDSSFEKVCLGVDYDLAKSL
jgi:hypothetical protein